MTSVVVRPQLGDPHLQIDQVQDRSLWNQRRGSPLQLGFMTAFRSIARICWAMRDSMCLFTNQNAGRSSLNSDKREGLNNLTSLLFSRRSGRPFSPACAPGAGVGGMCSASRQGKAPFLSLFRFATSWAPCREGTGACRGSAPRFFCFFFFLLENTRRCARWVGKKQPPSA